MFVKILKYYAFVENRHRIEKVTEPSWERIEEEIRRMNGATYTCVTISLSATAEENQIYTLTVGGGLDGLYSCSVSLNERMIVHDLTDLSRSAEEIVELPIGTEWFQIPSQEIVGLDVTLAGARGFAEEGELDAALPWRRRSLLE